MKTFLFLILSLSAGNELWAMRGANLFTSCFSTLGSKGTILLRSFPNQEKLIFLEKEIQDIEKEGISKVKYEENNQKIFITGEVSRGRVFYEFEKIPKKNALKETQAIHNSSNLTRRNPYFNELATSVVILPYWYYNQGELGKGLYRLYRGVSLPNIMKKFSQLSQSPSLKSSPSINWYELGRRYSSLCKVFVGLPTPFFLAPWKIFYIGQPDPRPYFDISDSKISIQPTSETVASEAVYLFLSAIKLNPHIKISEWAERITSFIEGFDPAHFERGIILSLIIQELKKLAQGFTENNPENPTQKVNFIQSLEIRPLLKELAEALERKPTPWDFSSHLA